MEKRINRVLSKEVRQKIVAKLSQGYWSLSRDLDVPVSILCNVINKFKPMVLSQSPWERTQEKSWPKLSAKDCSNGWDLGQLQNRFKLTFRYSLQLFQLAPPVTNSMKGGSMVRDPGWPHCWQRDTRKLAGVFQKTPEQAKICLGEMRQNVQGCQYFQQWLYRGNCTWVNITAWLLQLWPVLLFLFKRHFV